MNNIKELVKSKSAKATTQETEETTRFMLVLDLATRNKLRAMCEKLNVPQIGFASEIFTLALNEAVAALEEQLKPQAKP